MQRLLRSVDYLRPRTSILYWLTIEFVSRTRLNCTCIAYDGDIRSRQVPPEAVDGNAVQVDRHRDMQGRRSIGDYSAVRLPCFHLTRKFRAVHNLHRRLPVSDLLVAQCLRTQKL